MREGSAAVDAEALRAELMSVSGVASAEVDVGESSAPAGVRVRLTPDADARRVGAEVQRVLAGHGMRSRFSQAESGGTPATDGPSSSALPRRSSRASANDWPTSSVSWRRSPPPSTRSERRCLNYRRSRPSAAV